MPRASHPVARLVEPLIVPAVFDFWASKLNRTLSWERCLARVVECRPEARDCVTLVLRPNRHFAGYLPGQHLNISVEVDGVRLTRCYSPTSLPGPDRTFAITVKAMAGGKVSQALVHETRVGDVLEIGPGEAFGDMVLPADASDGRWLFAAAGSGITPLMALLRELLARDAGADVVLMYWVRAREDLCFRGELADLARAHPHVRVVPVLTGGETPAAGELSGRPEASHFQPLADLGERHVRACGPRGFVDAISALLSEAVPDIQCESFTPALPVPATGVPVTVTLARSGRQVQLPSGQALLPALEAAGIQPAHGCRQGICNTCSCQKLAGNTRDLLLGQDDTEAGAIKLCVSSAQTNLTLDL